VFLLSWVAAWMSNLRWRRCRVFAAAACLVLSKNHGVGAIGGCLHLEMIFRMELGRLKYVVVGVWVGVVPGKMCSVMSNGMRGEWDSPSDVSISSIGSIGVGGCRDGVVGLCGEGRGDFI